MLSESSRNQKSMWTKLPAALRWISAVHHCTLCDTFHQLNTKHDKELLRNNLLFNSVRCSELLHKMTENCATNHKHSSRNGASLRFFRIHKLMHEKYCGLWELQKYGSASSSASLPQLDIRTQIKLKAGVNPGHAGDRDPRTCRTELQHSLAATRDFSGEATVSAALHKSGLCGRAARWQETAARSLQKGTERF